MNIDRVSRAGGSRAVHTPLPPPPLLARCTNIIRYVALITRFTISQPTVHRFSYLSSNLRPANLLRLSTSIMAWPEVAAGGRGGGGGGRGDPPPKFSTISD